MIRFPTAGTKRALLIIDVQTATLSSEGAYAVLDTMRRYIDRSAYDAYVVAVYSAPDDSMFVRQSGWPLSAEAAGPTDERIEQAVARHGKPVLHIAKTVRSIFKGAQGGEVESFLADHAIDEVHLVGFDVNDCVLSTAYDALDRGFFTYAIEECCGRTDSDSVIIDAALTVMRRQAMTNRSTRLGSLEIDV